MSQTMSKMDLVQYLKVHFGSIRHCATVLEISYATLYNICKENPERILNYTNKLLEVNTVDVRELIDVIYDVDEA